MGLKRCVHCLGYFVKITEDHVLPRSWYPESTPKDVGKWTIPACESCNKEYGQIEGDLLIRLGLCLDPSDKAAAGIPQRVLRAISERHGSGARDKRCRKSRYKKLMRESLSGGDIPDKGIYPNFGASAKDKSPLGFLIPASSVQKLGEKIVRGITYIAESKYIEKPFRIAIYVVEDNAVAAVLEDIKHYSREYSVGPGIKVLRAIGEDSSALFYISIWGKFNMYASVMKPE